MAITEERLIKAPEPALPLGPDRAPTLPDEDRLAPALEDRSPAKSRDWSPWLFVAWVAAFLSMVLLEPQPTQTPAEIPAWANALAVVFTLAFMAALIGLATRVPWGLGASVVAGGLGMLIAGACLATDHHAVGWAAYEMVAFSALTVTSLRAPRSS